MNDPSIIKLAGMRGIIARKMCESLQNTAQLTFHADCDASHLVARRNRMKADGMRVSYEDMICKTVSNTLLKFPAFNGHVNNNEINLFNQHHIAVAIALPNGLVAPTIFDVQDKPLEAIGEARRDLLERAKANALTLQEMTGGTFTISNLGMTRVRYFTPILNLPQIAILGLGELRKINQHSNDEQFMMSLSLTVDHRAVDGYPCGLFLTSLCEGIEAIDTVK